MTPSFPFLTAHDPPGTGEGSLDPLGLYQIADQLAVELVPAVRERMLRVRFLTAIALGALVTEGLESDPRYPDTQPFLVWEWLVVEAFMRTRSTDPTVWGVAGTLVVKQALKQYQYVDARSYLKTPRIFGFHGVFKRLAVHLGLVTADLNCGPNAERLAEAWARGQGAASFAATKPLRTKWRLAVERSLKERPPRTKTGWSAASWNELAGAFAPGQTPNAEANCLRQFLRGDENAGLGALPSIWSLLVNFAEKGFREDHLHRRLGKERPEFRPLLAAICNYERFARSLQDGFDLMRGATGVADPSGIDIKHLAGSEPFRRATEGLHDHYAAAHASLPDACSGGAAMQGLFSARFAAFAAPLTPDARATALCEHHEQIQKAKSATGKRPWFDRLGPDRVYMRYRYRQEWQEKPPEQYVHPYRGLPLGRFRRDLESPS